MFCALNLLTTSLLSTTTTILVLIHTKNVFVWYNHINNNYIIRSGYSWLIHNKDRPNNHNSEYWSWIYKFYFLEKTKFLFWFVCHNFVCTLSLLHHKNIITYASYSISGLKDSLFFIMFDTAMLLKTFDLTLDYYIIFSIQDTNVWLGTGSSNKLYALFAART